MDLVHSAVYGSECFLDKDEICEINAYKIFSCRLIIVV